MSFSNFQKIVYLQRQMSRDDDLEYSELHSRDRSITLTTDAPESPDEEGQLSYWLSKMVTPADQQLAAEIDSGHRLIRIGLGFLGALFGWLTIIGLFQYDGQNRVNLVYLLLVLVVLQLSLTGLTLIAMLPQSLTRWLPGFHSFQQLLRWFSPGRLQKLFSRFMPATERDGILQLLGRQQKIYAGIGKWQVFSWSQLFAVAFNLAALISVFGLIASRDIAFGWSSTLDIDPDAILSVTNMLSWPWHAWLPASVPDLQLIETSQYFRVQNTAVQVSPEVLGHWWPFVMLSLLFYGLLPRLLLLMFCKVQLGAAYAHAFQHFPGRQELLTRLNSAVIETRASEHESNTDAFISASDTEKPQRISEALILINWAGFEFDNTKLLDDLMSIGQFTKKTMFKAGINCRLEDDEQVIAEISKLDAGAPIGLILKAWEPPLGELADFIADLRKIGSPQRMIYLLPLAIKSQALLRVENNDLQEWQRFAQQLADPWITVHTIMSGDAA
ncbi:MAG: DUF2868 domain-containing protein [Xanthomonadales bacterium]|nr:DUF2868 domain-containing protein [Xanthomonadales bacterium]